ncbi:MAG TPA: hypothetical protein VJ890_13280 [Vineibacter sp.]|nr:hypothetical protein [Vineibacter sp.]
MPGFAVLRRGRWLVSIGLALLAACTTPPSPAGPVGEIVAEGVIVCPPPTERCELSGATVTGGQLLLVNDRAHAGQLGDSVLVVPLDALAGRIEARYLPGLPKMPAEKLEAITTTSDGRHVFAITSFDRHDAANSAQDRFNMLLTWPAQRPQAARVLGAEPGRGGASLQLRRQLRAALATAAEPQGPGYFKVEGLAALPDQLLIGVREIGASYHKPQFTLIILAVPWTQSPAGPVLAGPAKVVWRLEPAALGPLPMVPVGLSDLAYDAAADRLWLLTSVERDDSVDGVAGYIWRLDRAALARGAPPVPLRGRDGKPLLFRHKPEALAILPDGRLLVVHDDDRRATLVRDPASGTRRPRLQNEGIWQAVGPGDSH